MSRQELENVRAGTSLIRVTISWLARRSASQMIRGIGGIGLDQLEERSFDLGLLVDGCGMKDALVHCGQDDMRCPRDKF
jgi:hypothetical protein